jgi:hypothetical protein
MNHTDHNNDYSDREIRIRPLVIFLIATLVVTGATLLFVKYLFDRYGMDVADKATEMYEAQVAPQRPTKAVVEGLGEAAVALKQYRAYVDDKLNHARWIDREAGIVQIPISVAMEQVVAAGLPVRENPAE